MLKGEDVEQVKIYNIHGQLIIAIAVNNDEKEIDLASHPKGIYFVKAQYKNGLVATKKLIIN